MEAFFLVIPWPTQTGNTVVIIAVTYDVQGSNESSDDEHQSPYSDGDTDPGITDPGVTEPGLPSVIYVDEDSAHDHSNDPMMSMGSTAFWDPPDLQHPANSSRLLDTSTSDVGTGSSTEPSQGASSASANTVTARPSPVTKRVARVRKRHLGMLQTMLEASRRAAEFVTSVRYHLASLCHTSEFDACGIMNIYVNKKAAVV